MIDFMANIMIDFTALLIVLALEKFPLSLSLRNFLTGILVVLVLFLFFSPIAFIDNPILFLVVLVINYTIIIKAIISDIE